ncbi:MAG TPA: hypothetical protein VEC12_12885, partial [Bacteroidia bacterium]|nr:hypothetical protein [Bacteroidia bacterium]
MKKLFTVLALTFVFLSGPLIAQTTCGTDTVYYTWYKTSQFRAVSLNTSTSGNSFAQYFPAPQTITVSGFDFFAWQSQGNNSVVALTCNIFRAGADSLPIGAPLRTVTVNVDSSFKGGQLADLRKSAIFSTPVAVNFPYILTIETSSSTNVSVICNDYMSFNGDGEWLSSVRIGANYIRAYTVTVGTTIFDADWIFMPHVSYSLSADFSFVGCNDSSNTITFTNKSSAIMENRFYNLYAFYGITQICYLWNYGDASGTFYTINGSRRYNTRNDYNISLKDTLYGWRVGCSASKSKTIYGTPLPPILSNDGPHCSGEPLSLFADSVTGGTYSWTGPKSFSSILRNPSFAVSDTSLVGTYSANVTVNGCTSKNAITQVVINQTPQTPVASNDGPKCVGDSVEFVVNTFDPGIQTTWTGPNSFSNHSPSFKFTNVDTSLRGKYIVYTETAFCQSERDTTDFYVYPPPAQPTVGVLTNDTLCNGDTLYLAGNSVPGAVFSWSGPGGFTSSASHPVIPNATALEAGKYKTHVIIGSCTSTPDSIDIVVNPLPSLDITVTDTSFCDGDSASFS